MDFFMEEIYKIEPIGTGFSGKLWLLVNESNYSSSEYASMFSKHSGFATLVGYPTRGGGGVDPTYIILPKTSNRRKTASRFSG
jgi:C-terminal processing protease CtpA/Prc